mgnify:CR=1 FL=1|jgi:hypothetical protein
MSPSRVPRHETQGMLLHVFCRLMTVGPEDNPLTAVPEYRIEFSSRILNIPAYRFAAFWLIYFIIVDPEYDLDILFEERWFCKIDFC